MSFVVTDTREFEVTVKKPAPPPPRPPPKPPVAKPVLKIVDLKYPSTVSPLSMFWVTLKVRNEGGVGFLQFADVVDASTGRSIVRLGILPFHTYLPKTVPRVSFGRGLPIWVMPKSEREVRLPCMARREEGTWRLRAEVGYYESRFFKFLT